MRAFCLAAFLLIFPLSSAAQEQDVRTQFWDVLEVDAHLDADGRLHVRELQRMVFDGAWNGGERHFYLGEGHRLDVERLVRIDAQGQEHPLVEGDLEHVDHYGWSGGNTLRWRARLPSDLPFQETVLTYRIDYVLTGILRYTSDGYLLNHDFAFADRSGEIRHARLRLTLDPEWTPDEVITTPIETQQLEPGDGWVLRRTLQHAGQTLPLAVRHGALPQTRMMLLQAMVGGSVLMFVLFLWREVRAGRFRKLVPLKEINRAWIERHVLTYPPEVVGAFWDGDLGAAEVAAVLARMTHEGKLSSRVETSTGWLFKHHRLHLALKVSRNTLRGHERALIDALFFDGNETDTDKVRRHYQRSGFNPADYIEEAVENQIRHITGPTPPHSRSGRFFFLIILVAMLFMPVHFVYGTSEDIFAGAFAVLATFFFLMLGSGAINAYRNDCNFPLSGLIYLVIVATLAAFPVVVLLHDNPGLNSTYLLVELVILWFLLVGSMLLTACTHTRPKELEQQHLLRSARAWFAAELAKPKPELENSWYPYLLAFGLGQAIDRWFGAFGGTAAMRSETMDTGSMTGSSFSPSSSTWSGGGGNFGGGGTSGTWAAAADGMAASIATPGSSVSSRSSSSSSSSSSRSSSGGGGGGAW